MVGRAWCDLQNSGPSSLFLLVSLDCSNPRGAFAKSILARIPRSRCAAFFCSCGRFPNRSRRGRIQPVLQIHRSGVILMESNLSAPEARKMAKASWVGKIIAESGATVVVEGNHYFPPEAVKKELLRPSNHTTVCPWKGTAHYYHVEVDGLKNDNAAWYYPEPKPEAAEIKDRIAFWKGVRVEI